jgi:hypothetical protein
MGDNIDKNMWIGHFELRRNINSEVRANFGGLVISGIILKWISKKQYDELDQV